MATNINDCSGTPFNYEPEYNTSAPQNIVPWAALQVNTSTQFETGHFEACSRLTQPFSVNQIPFPGLAGFTDVSWNKCHGPYENAAPAGSEKAELGDAFCYPSTTVPVCDLIMVRSGLPAGVLGSGGSGRGPGVFAAIGTRCSRVGGRRRSWAWWPGSAGVGLQGR